MTETTIRIYDKMPEFIESVLNVFYLVNKRAETKKDERLRMISLVILNYVRKMALDFKVNLKEIPLKDLEGRMVSEDIVRSGLANRGFDPNDFTNLKSFLIRNKKITSGIFEGNFNLFGMKPLLISEAVDKGKFAHLPDREQSIIKNLENILQGLE